jgi:hypothetical protein
MPRKPVKYVAEISHVREVSLRGAADLAYWKNKLEHENLILTETDGQAQILITAADAKYMGMRFREASFSILTSGYKGVEIAGAYLLQAFNSNRFFAFCERTLFSTPYSHADVRVSCRPVFVKCMPAREDIFQADMRADNSAPSREPVRCGVDGWEGPVFLPGGKGRGKRDGKFFIAKITGDTQVYSFLPNEDTLLLSPSRSSNVIQSLIDSGFTCREWAVREDATHAKSTTYASIEALTELAWE